MADDENGRMKRSQELKALRAQLAKLPREIAPERELWLDIRAAIDASSVGPVEPQPVEVESVTANHAPTGWPATLPDDRASTQDEPPSIVRELPWARRVAWSRARIAAAAAAMLVVGASLWIGMIDDHADLAPDARRVADRYARLEEPYVAAAAELTATLERRRDEMPPDVIAPFTSALALIDEAVRETRAAVAADPDNEALAEMAIAAHRRKLDFLQRVAQWSTEE